MGLGIRQRCKVHLIGSFFALFAATYLISGSDLTINGLNLFVSFAAFVISLCVLCELCVFVVKIRR
jgi:hypothetical protein